MKASDLFKSQYLAAEDLPPNAVTVLIQKVDVEELREPSGKLRPKLILSFKGAKKRMVLNKTNAMFLAQHAGDETGGWVGWKVVLTTQKVMFEGKLTNAIRLVDVIQPDKVETPPAGTGGVFDGQEA